MSGTAIVYSLLALGHLMACAGAAILGQPDLALAQFLGAVCIAFTGFLDTHHNTRGGHK